MKEFQLKFITNKQTIRLLKILFSFQSRSELTLKDLAEITNSSDRTTLTDINRIKEIFSKSIHLKSTYNGYIFNILSLEEYNNKKRALLDQEPLYKIVESIFFNECLTIEEWSETLFTTINTLNKQLSAIQKVLKDYDITISKNPIDFIGNEINIRQFFHDFYYESDITPHTVFPSLEVQSISSTLRSELFSGECGYISFTEFNYVLFITLERISTRQLIEDNFLDKSSANSYLLNFLQNINLSFIKKLVALYVDFQLPDSEIIYLAIQLTTRRSLLSLSSEQKFISKIGVCNLVKNIALDYCKEILVTIEDWEQSLLYFESFFIATKIKHFFAPILNQNIPDVTLYTKNMFPSQFNSTQSFISNNLSPELNLSQRQINDISANLVLYTDSMRNLHWKKNRQIAILLEGNRYITENIRSNAQRYLGKHYSLFFPDVAQLSIDYFTYNKIDLIVTNYSEYLINWDYGIEIVLFEMMPTKKDWYYLFQLLSPSLMDKLKTI